MDRDKPKRSRRWRFSAIVIVAGLAFFAVAGLANRYVEAFASNATVPKAVRPGQLLILKFHPLVPALSFGTMPAKGGRTALTINLE